MRILVVEDEHRIATTIKKGLEQEKYVVDLCFNGTDALDLGLTEDYDVIVLDRMLPEMDGLKICVELRKKNIHTPILILTSRGQTQDKIEGLDAGADDYLTKPFSFEELLARLRALSRRPKNSIETVMSVGDLSLNPKTFIVKRADKPIHLSGKEFALLEYLIRNKETILSKDQIVSHVWNYDSDVLPNTVEVYIRNLRNKIDNPFTNKKPLLHTVRGFGYKIGE